MMPLDHDLPNVIVHLHFTVAMKVDPAVESMKTPFDPVDQRCGV
jgi:hypothetical protein